MNTSEAQRLLARAVMANPSLTVIPGMAERWAELLRGFTYAEAAEGLDEAQRREDFLTVKHVRTYALIARDRARARGPRALERADLRVLVSADREGLAGDRDVDLAVVSPEVRRAMEDARARLHAANERRQRDLDAAVRDEQAERHRLLAAADAARAASAAAVKAAESA